MKAIIVAGGSYIDKQLFIDNYENGDFIICADSGLNFLDSICVLPNLIVGDLDSVNKNILPKYKNIDLEKYNPMKDFTDSEIAIEKAIERGFNDILFICATGTRLDHTMANILMLEKYMKQNVNIKIIDNHNVIQVINKDISITKGKYTYVSIIPISEELYVKELIGFKYHLIDTLVKRGSTLCVSNEILDNQAVIQISSGIALLIFSQD